MEKTKLSKISELKALLDSIKLVNSTLDLNAVLDHLMELAKKATGSEAASALLIEGDKLCFTAASGKKSAEIRKVYLGKSEGAAGWVISRGKPLIIGDVSKDARFSEKADRSSGFVTRSILAVPLKIEDRMIGVVEAVNKRKKGKFSKDDVKALSNLADSAAVAINKAQLYADLNDLFLSVITAFAKAIEAKDPYTRGHSERVRDLSMVIGMEMGLPGKSAKELEITALLHDIGKIGVSETVLRKAGKLDDSEFAEIKKHPGIGAEILSSIKQLSTSIMGVRHHQERFDGRGYPSGLKGRGIPLFGRIIAVADTFDAMTSNRPYRDRLSDETALAEIKRCSGTQFDPACVEAFISGYTKGLVKSS